MFKTRRYLGPYDAYGRRFYSTRYYLNSGYSKDELKEQVEYWCGTKWRLLKLKEVVLRYSEKYGESPMDDEKEDLVWKKVVRGLHLKENDRSPHIFFNGFLKLADGVLSDKYNIYLAQIIVYLFADHRDTKIHALTYADGINSHFYVVALQNQKWFLHEIENEDLLYKLRATITLMYCRDILENGFTPKTVMQAYVANGELLKQSDKENNISFGDRIKTVGILNTLQFYYRKKTVKKYDK